MITIRSPKDIAEATLIGFDAILETPHGVYEFSSDGPVVDPTSPFGGGLFGSISWPRSIFRLGPETMVEQQMFLPHDSPDAALSWQLRGKMIPARLTIKPRFAGCTPPSYRDAGFRPDAEENGGRLSWLPNVRGPKIIAATNGRYCDEPLRFFESFAPSVADSNSLVVPGRFEFKLGSQPSVLIFSSDNIGTPSHSQHVGMFLAGVLGDTAREPIVTDATADSPELVAAA